MFIYSVMRFGNDENGPDGDDTEFLVLADNVTDAAAVVDAELKKMPHNRVVPFCHAIVSIGKSYSENDKAVIISGPLLTHNSLLDLGVPEDNIWRRSGDVEGGDWVKLDEY